MESIVCWAPPCPPGGLPAAPLVDEAMILSEPSRYQPEIRILRLASAMQPRFRN